MSIMYGWQGTERLSEQIGWPARVMLLVLIMVASGATTRADALDRKEIESRLSAITSSTTLEETERVRVAEAYRAALDEMDKAAALQKKRDSFRRALDEADSRRSEAEAALSAARAAAELASQVELPGADYARIQEALRVAHSDLAAAQAEAERLQKTLDDMRRRQGQIPVLIEQAQDQLAKGGDESIWSAGARQDEAAVAQGVLAEARKAAIEADVEAMALDRASYEARRSIVELQLAAVEAKINGQLARIEALVQRERALVAGEADEAESLVRRAREELGAEGAGASSALERLADSLASLVDRSRVLAAKNEEASAKLRQATARLQSIRDALREVRDHTSSGAYESGLAETIFSQLRSFQGGLERAGEIDYLRRALAEARREHFLLRQATRSREGASGTALPEAAVSGKPKGLQGELEGAVLSMRRKLEFGASQLVETLSHAEAVESEAMRMAAEYRDAVIEKLFWVKSAPSIDMALTAVHPSDVLEWSANVLHPGWLMQAMSSVAPWLLVVALLLLASRLLLRRRLLGYVVKTSTIIRRISTDRMSLTLSAFGATLLASAPVPLAMLLLGWGLSSGGDAGQRLLAAFFVQAAPLVFHLALLANAVHPSGLAEGHFGWSKDILARVRVAVIWLALVMLPARMLQARALAVFSEDELSGMARLALLLMVAGVGGLGVWMFHARHGIPAIVARRSPQTLIARFPSVWAPAIAIGSLVLLALLLAGYVMTVWLLVARLEDSVYALFWAVIVHGLAIRMFAIRERKLKLEAAMAERKARQEAARREVMEHNDGTQPAEAVQDDLPELPESDEPVDLSTVCRQTRDLIGFVVSAVLLGVLWMLWTQFAPIVRAFDERELIWSLTVADIGLVILVTAVALAVVRNLPGLLEALVFHRLDMATGSRSSFVKLAQYAVFALAAVVLSSQVGIDWSKLGWLAAALSVGIGFGLQEVVANFVSGIILLFERPIRIGDVVTVDGIDGVVSRIQIRATTITGWDRKEYVVPNKSFITGTVLNWTLSNPVNRVVIVVGVAYGSDIERAREILIEVAREQPAVLKDPAPLATFEEFGDSALKLVLRAYLPNMDNRITTLSALNTEIARRFREAGIEIAYPQLDVHLRRP